MCARDDRYCTDGFLTDHYRDFRESDVFHIHPHNAPQVFKVVCKMDKWTTGWAFLCARRRGAIQVNFSRTWEDYKNGFGNFGLRENYWSGLDVMHYVTNNRPHKLRVQILFQENRTNVWRNHDYLDFKVSSEQHGYNFTFSSAVPPRINEAIDGLSASMGVRFSTYDIDNDNDSGGNCASIHQSGWWFTTCDGYNPTGQPQPPSVQYQDIGPHSTVLASHTEL
ncbi:fibrinogen-like protein 1 [Haliotis rubra]|uniref:fibrinogen-like protein 1 n=1 Tax=Haliotis rubra TaxID=36100 RepID=UPI001EE58226|nr:fibrinogen-like protein 1 [Haliotis rubra]